MAYKCLLNKEIGLDIGCKVTCALIAYSLYLLNRPFLISKNLHFQKEAKSQNFSSKNYFICLRIKKSFSYQ